MESLQELITERMSYSRYKAFCIGDFLDLASYDAIRKALDRLEDSGEIRRIIRGIYDRPRFNKRFNEYELPDIESVAKALARNYNWIICPSGNLALNLLGLSRQVPSCYTYISNGPYLTYIIAGVELRFKHSASRSIADFFPITRLLIQALKAIGRENLLYDDIVFLRSNLSEEEKGQLLRDRNKTNRWIRDVIGDICEV